MNFIEMYKHDKFGNDAGVELKELNENHAIVTMTVGRQHLNAGGFVHGGALFLMADVAMAAMANFSQAPSVSIQSDMRFLAAGVEGDLLTAEAVEVLGRRSLYYSRVTITNQRGEMIAIAEGMFHTKRVFKVEE